MYQLNKRVGFFKKRLAQNEGNVGLMYFDQNWYRVRSVINSCKTIEEIEEKMVKEEFKFIEIKKYQISTIICNHPYGDSVPFTNKLCFEMVFVQNQNQQLQLFGLSDDTDIQELYNFVKTIDATSPAALQQQQQQSKKDPHENSPIQIKGQNSNSQDNTKSNNFFTYVEQQYLQKIEETKDNNNHEINESENQQQQQSNQNQQQYQYLYDILKNKEIDEQNNEQQNNINNNEQQMQELSDQVTYSGQMKNNMPHGYGKEFSNDGIQYEGYYRFGQRHGPGQFVDSNLDMHSYEYIQGRPVGI